MKRTEMTLITLALTPVIALATTLSDGLVAHYKFDGNANDSTVNKNDGIVHCAKLTSDRFGNANRAYSFDGDSWNSWIEVPNSTSLQKITKTMTFSAWVKPAANHRGHLPVLCKGVARRQYGFLLSIQDDHDWIMINDGANNGDHNEINCRLSAGSCNKSVWYHAAATYDGKMFKSYINGECVGSVAVADGFTADTSSVYIGMDPPGWTEFMKGALDEIRIYDRALSEKEIADIYTQEGRN